MRFQVGETLETNFMIDPIAGVRPYGTYMLPPRPLQEGVGVAAARHGQLALAARTREF